MTIVRKILRKARRIPDPPKEPIAPINQAYLDSITHRQYRNGVELRRDQNFAHARVARQVQIDRQSDIMKVRLKNLKKGRLKRLRSL